MSKKQQKKYGPGGKYYRKRIKRPDGKWEDVYGLTQTELSEKVTVRQAQLAAEAAGTPENPFVYEYAAGWYARKSPGMSENARQQKRFQINKVICPVIGQKPMREITSDDIDAVMSTRAMLGKSAQQKTVTVLRQIFEAAEEAGVIDRLPTRKLKPGGKNGAMPDALTEAQQTALLAAVRGLAVEPCVQLALYTGLRREEICALTWRHIHLDGKTAFLNVRQVCRWPGNNQPVVEAALKSSSAWRTVPIPDPLRDYLQDLRAARLDVLHKRSKKRGDAAALQRAKAELQDLFVYGDEKGRPISMATFRRRWETIRARSTASGRAMGEKSRNHRTVVVLDFFPNPHLLRHTYITRLILGRVDLKRVQYLAGHADPQLTLRIYTALMGHQPEDLIDDVNAIFAPKPAAGSTP